VKITHLCKQEGYGAKNWAAWVTPQLKQTGSSSLNSISPQSGISGRGDAQAVAGGCSSTAQAATSPGVTAPTWYKPSPKAGAGVS